MTLARHLYAILGLATVLTALSFSSGSFGTSAARSQPQSVIVANSSSQKVPITGTVAVSTLPAVQLQSGTSVSVNNTAANPLNVVGPAAPARTFIYKSNIFDFDSSSVSAGGDLYTVPAGKRFILKDAFVRLSLAPGQTCNAVGLGAIGFDFEFPVQAMGSNISGQPSFCGVMNGCEFVFDEGAKISAGAVRSGTGGDGDLTVGITGYLEDLPSATP